MQLEEFTNMVLPKYFKHKNLPSFIRQLNMYGFTKTVMDSNVHDFCHPYFRKDRKELLAKIKRKPSSDSKKKDLEEHKHQTDLILTELASLRRRSEAMQSRLERMEEENTVRLSCLALTILNRF